MKYSMGKIFLMGLLLLVVSCLDSQSLSQQQQVNNASVFNDTNKKEIDKLTKCERLKLELPQFKPYPYVWGGESVKEGGYDCSGFIYAVFKKIGNPVPRTTSYKYWVLFDGKEIHWKEAKCIDLVWFTFSSDRPFGHIGIVTQIPKFWQSGSSTGPTESKLWVGGYWNKRFQNAKRINFKEN